MGPTRQCFIRKILVSSVNSEDPDQIWFCNVCLFFMSGSKHSKTLEHSLYVTAPEDPIITTVDK